MFKNRQSSKIGTPLALAGFGVALAIGGSAAAISPAAATALAPLVTAVKCSVSSACVSGTNTGSGPGVSGTSAKGIGVNGLSTSSYGLFGTSSSGVGVKAVSKTSSAIFATNNSPSYATINAQQTGSGDALNGNSTSGVGLHATSVNNDAVFGYSENNAGGAFQSSSNSYALAVDAFNSNGRLIYAKNDSTGKGFYVDADANLEANTVTAYGSSFISNHKTTDGRRVAAYGAESSSATIEDFGSGRLTNGVAVVPLEHTFRQTIDARSGYSVFLSAGGDNRGLYVVKSPGSFTIHEAQGGRSTLAFDYRIVAHPADEVATRLPAAAPEHAPFAALGR